MNCRNCNKVKVMWEGHLWKGMGMGICSSIIRIVIKVGLILVELSINRVVIITIIIRIWWMLKRMGNLMRIKSYLIQVI